MGALTERAKLLWQTGKREAALNSLNVGLRALAPDSLPSNLAQSLVMPAPHFKTIANKVYDNDFLLQVSPHIIANVTSLSTSILSFFFNILSNILLGPVNDLLLEPF